MLKSGFFNSVFGDRKYDAETVGSMFDGLINDGIFATWGDAFIVHASTGMTLNVGTGRGWFNRTWNVLEAVIPINVDVAEVLQDRIDTMVLEVDKRSETRNNSIRIIKGTPSLTPSAPTLVRSLLHNQYPLCDIRVNRGVTTITQDMITNRIGLSETPFVTGIIDTINVEKLLIQWEAQFQLWAREAQTEHKQWADTEKQRFLDWFADVQDVLDEDTAGKLLNRIIALEDKVANLETIHIFSFLLSLSGAIRLHG